MRIHPPPPSLETRDGGVVLSPTSSSTNPSTEHVKHACQRVLRVPFLPHPAEHVKHVRLGMFMCSSPPSVPIPLNMKNTPIWVCFSCSPPSLPLKHERHAQMGVSMCCFHFDTMRRACPPSHRVFVSILTWREWVYPSSPCCHFDVARRGLSLLVVLCIFKAMR
jgi:hypothetical protein